MRCEHRTLDVMAPRLVARVDVGPVALQRTRQRRIVHQNRILWQVVKERRGGLKEERQVELDSSRRQSLAYSAIDARLRGLALETCAEAATKEAHAIGIERHLARRQHAHARE